MQEVATLIDIAVDYAQRGWYVVPLHNLRDDDSCSCHDGMKCPQRNRGKHPRLTAWQKHASNSPEQVEKWWDSWPQANIGILLGEKSGVIDVECDSEEAEKELTVLFGGEFPVAPTFSASRGKHRLFAWSPGLPEPDKAVFKWGGIEFRTGGGARGAQSVFPPSIHPTRKRYEWLVHPDEAELMPLPLRVIETLLGTKPPVQGGIPENIEAAGGVETVSQRWKLYDQEQIIESVDGRDNIIHAEACAMWREQVVVHGVSCLDDAKSQAVVFERIWGLNVYKCKPPLDRQTVLQKVESARKFLKEQNSGPRNTSLTSLGLEFRDGEWWPGQWKLETINSDPPGARLFAPFLPRGFIEMTMLEFDQPVCVHRAVLAATGRICLSDRPGFWASIWDGKPATSKTKATRGVKAKLIEESLAIEAPPEVRRAAIIASMVLAQFSNAKTIEDGQYPNPRGAPTQMPDGSIVAVFDLLLERMSFSADKINRNDLSKVLRDAGAVDKLVTIGLKKQKRMKVLNREALNALQQIADCNTDAPKTSASSRLPD